MSDQIANERGSEPAKPGSLERMVGLRAMRLYALESKFCAECGLAATGETQHALAAAMHYGLARAFEYTMKQSNDQAHPTAAGGTGGAQKGL